MPDTDVAPALRALLEQVVDYAGLFPPAGLSMREAVAEYAAQRASRHSWMLGRFVVPIARLDELATEAVTTQGDWPLSVLVSADPAGDAATLTTWSRAQRGRFTVTSVELAAASADAVERAMSALDPSLERYVEIPLDHDPEPLLEVIRRARARAKARTGGVKAEAFPTAAQLARFIIACARLRVPFKATAGLHHPVRGEQRLTYEPAAPCTTMFGFLNVFIAAALAHGGTDAAALEKVLEERDATSFRFAGDELRWRDFRIGLDPLRASRHALAIAFGSCSFGEPVDDLHQLGLL